MSKSFHAFRLLHIRQLECTVSSQNKCLYSKCQTVCTHYIRCKDWLSVLGNDRMWLRLHTRFLSCYMVIMCSIMLPVYLCGLYVAIYGSVTWCIVCIVSHSSSFVGLLVSVFCVVKVFWHIESHEVTMPCIVTMAQWPHHCFPLTWLLCSAWIDSEVQHLQRRLITKVAHIRWWFQGWLS